MKTFKQIKIFNLFLSILSAINLSLDFEGQSQKFRFIVDCIDFGFFILIIIPIAITIILELKNEGELKKTTIIDIVIMTVCSVGVIYEGAVATSFNQFVSAETTAAKVLRTFKYLRVMLFIFDKDIWEEGHKLIVCIFQAVLELRNIMLIWLVVILTLTMMGFHLHTGNTMIDSDGNLDLANGKPQRISFATPYHALILTILAVYDEEWDYLMFQEYVGSGVMIVIWMLLIMIVGHIVFSKYLTCLLSQKLEETIESYEAAERAETSHELEEASSIDDG